MRLPVLQVVPPGFHLIPLPFRDDIRQPEADPALLARVAAGRTGPPRANEQQVGTDVDMTRPTLVVNVPITWHFRSCLQFKTFAVYIQP